VHITTNVVSSNPAHSELYSVHYNVIKCVSFLRFPPPIKQTLWYRCHGDRIVVWVSQLNLCTHAWQVSYILLGRLDFPNNKTDPHAITKILFRHVITEILLKVALSTNKTLSLECIYLFWLSLEPLSFGCKHLRTFIHIYLYRINIKFDSNSTPTFSRGCLLNRYTWVHFRYLMGYILLNL
jgi:hypothetical protein